MHITFQLPERDLLKWNRKSSSKQILMNEYCSFPREDDSAPRTKILVKECPEEYNIFKEVYNKI